MDKRTAEVIVDEIITDLTDRKGFDAMWDEIDDDIRDEIRDTWIKIVMAERA